MGFLRTSDERFEGLDGYPFPPKGYESVHRFIPGVAALTPIILEGGSHFLIEDIPEAYADEVLKFLNGQTGGA